MADANASVTMGARVLMLTGAVGALLALCLPWVYEESAVTVGSSTAVGTNSDEWTGWTLHGASRLDTHEPVSLLVYLIVIVGTAALLVGAWLAFERAERAWVPRSTAGVAALLLVASFPLLSGVSGTFGAGHLTTTRYGIIAWRVALAVVLAGAVRLSLWFEDRAHIRTRNLNPG